MIIVIGAQSFVGTYLVDRLVEDGKEVIATGRDIEDNNFFNDPENVKCINLDIKNKKDFEKFPKKNIEAIIHLAGLMPANIPEKEYSPYAYIDINIKGTLNVLEFCRENEIKKIVYTSSESDVSEQYGKLDIINENTPRLINYNNDHTVYAITKIASMDLIEHYNQKYNMKGVYFRLPNIFGYGQLLEHYKDGQLVLNGFGTFIKKAMRGEDIEIWGDPKKGRDVVYVKDLINMFVGAIDNPDSYGLYSVGTGSKTSLEEQVKGIIDIFGSSSKSKIIYKPEKPSVREYLFDISKAKRDLNYAPKYSYIGMLKDWKKEYELDRFPHFRERVKCLEN